MAKTKLVSDAVTLAQNEFKGITISTTDALNFANEINELILKANRWDFMTKAGTTFGTTAGTQDYASVPADFLWIKEAWIQDDSASTNPKMTLAFKDSLPQSTYRGMPTAIAVELESKFRLFRVPDQTRSGSGQWAILFEYYKRPTRLTATSNAFEFDDNYFDVFATGFVARVGQFLDWANAGQFLGRDALGQFRGTGLWGQFCVRLNEMIASESRVSDEPVFAPTEPLSL